MRAPSSALSQPLRAVPSTIQDGRPLADILFRPDDAALRRALEGLLSEELFDAQEGLTNHAAARLSYDRARFIARGLRSQSFQIENDPRALFLLHELLGPVDGAACTVLGIHYCLAIGSILAMGQEQRELGSILQELVEMRAFGVFLATELGYGNGVMFLETTARYCHGTDEFVLQSPSARSMKFMPNTAFPVAKIAVVMARLVIEERDCGVFPFVVRLRDRTGALLPGISITALSEKPGYALDNGITTFDAVRIPKAFWLSGPESAIDASGKFHSRIPSRRGRFLVAMDRVQTGRVCFTSGVGALLRSATWIALRYASQRLVSSPRGQEVFVVRYRNVQGDLFHGLAESYALTFTVRALQDLFVRSPAEPDTFNVVAILKATVSERVSALLPKLRERCGAVGLFSANRIIDYWVYTQGIITAEGDNQIMLLKVGRSLLESPEGADSSSSPGSASPVSAPPVRTESVSSESLSKPPPVFDPDDPRSVLKLARYRVWRLRRVLRQKVALSRSRSREPLSLWNDNVSGVMDLARAFGTRLVAEKFYEALSGLEPEMRALIVPLFRLWALNEVRTNAAWFLAEGCISEELYWKLPEHADAQLEVIEGSLDTLLTGLGVTNETLRAPIADDYVEHYERLSMSVPVSARVPTSRMTKRSGHRG